MQNPLFISDIVGKITNIEDSCHRALLGDCGFVPLVPGRDVEVVSPSLLPPKLGLSTAQGQARLLHDLASIELQAMELGLRTLFEFPQAPRLFREQLVDVVLDEARHLRLCLEAIANLGFRWGQWPAHIGLWQCVSCDDSLLDRIVIVHRYLEGSGLDASDTILRRLYGVRAKQPRDVVKVIAEEEIGHVKFGTDWYLRICDERGVDPQQDFEQRIFHLFERLPRRLEKINHSLRKRAGFTEGEIGVLEKAQKRHNCGH